MFADKFSKVENSDAVSFLEKLNPMLDGSSFSHLDVTILKHSLDFYSNCDFIEINDKNVYPPRILHLIHNTAGDNYHILDGTNEVLYQLNQTVPIQLNEDNIVTYVRFFFCYVRGKHGVFQIIDGVDDVHWKEEPAPNARKALGQMIEPLNLVAVTDSGEFALRASIIFKDSLFESSILVKKNGEVSLTNQEILVEDIPVLDDTFGH